MPATTTDETMNGTATAMLDRSFDETKAEAFAERFMTALNESALVVMISVGHRTGLFDAMDSQPPLTSPQLAEKAGLNERYVREWLGAMTTGRVVEYDPSSQTYLLPAEHARWLTRRVSPENMAVTAQWVAVLAGVETEVVEKFKQGGGVPYQCFHRFHETMAEESAQTVAAALHEHILPMKPELSTQLEKGIDVLDVGCGAGRSACALAEAFPNSRFTGYDLCEEAIAMATAEAKKRGLSNITFEARDVTALDVEDRFDLVTGFDVVHDQKEPATVLANIYQALKPGATFLMQDIAGSSHLEKNLDHPLGTFTYTISTMHCMTVSLAQGGQGLGTMWGEELAESMLNDAGFEGIEKRKLPHDIMNVYFTMTKPARK